MDVGHERKGPPEPIAEAREWRPLSTYSFSNHEWFGMQDAPPDRPLVRVARAVWRPTRRVVGRLAASAKAHVDSVRQRHP